MLRAGLMQKKSFCPIAVLRFAALLTSSASLLCALLFATPALADEVSAGRFQDAGDGTVLDKKTALMWTKDADMFGSKVPWQVAKEYVEEMNGGKRPNFGYADWRMPTISELATLFDKPAHPALAAGHPFTNVRDYFYWSSSTGFNVMGYAWVLDMTTGNVAFDYISYCSFRHFWPVRGEMEASAAAPVRLPALSTVDMSITSGNICTDAGPAAVKLPVMPQKLSAQAISTTEVALSWESPEAGAEVAWHNVYEGETLLKSVPEKFISIGGLKPKTRYCYAVSSFNSAGYESEKSTEVCVLTKEKLAEGTVWASGSNEVGQLGDGSIIDRASLVQVVGLEDVKKVSAGFEHVLALKADGTVWAWGRNDKGQLGDGTVKDSRIPVQIKGFSDVMDIAVGMYHSVALKSDGTVWTWGRNSYGQLGLGHIADRNVPTKVPGINGVVAIAAGGYHTVALRSGGTVWVWGWNKNGQLGAEEAEMQVHKPLKVNEISDGAAVAAGLYHTLVAKTDGTVWAWGYNKYGQVGDGTAVDRPVPALVNGISDVSAVAAGMEFSLALKKDGAVWAWGRNEHGQVGSRTDFKFTEPIKVKIENVIEISAGAYHAAALRTDGAVWVWGFRLIRDVDKDAVPSQMSGLTDIVSVSAGKRFTVAVKGAQKPPTAADTGGEAEPPAPSPK